MHSGPGSVCIHMCIHVCQNSETNMRTGRSNGQVDGSKAGVADKALLSLANMDVGSEKGQGQQ